jgi:hypothetical protein
LTPGKIQCFSFHCSTAIDRGRMQGSMESTLLHEPATDAGRSRVEKKEMQ